jgi:hypothetical protein
MKMKGTIEQESIERHRRKRTGAEQKRGRGEEGKRERGKEGKRGRGEEERRTGEEGIKKEKQTSLHLCSPLSLISTMGVPIILCKELVTTDERVKRWSEEIRRCSENRKNKNKQQTKHNDHYKQQSGRPHGGDHEQEWDEEKRGSISWIIWM